MSAGAQESCSSGRTANLSPMVTKFGQPQRNPHVVGTIRSKGQCQTVAGLVPQPHQVGEAMSRLEHRVNPGIARLGLRAPSVPAAAVT